MQNKKIIIITLSIIITGCKTKTKHENNSIPIAMKTPVSSNEKLALSKSQKSIIVKYLNEPLTQLLPFRFQCLSAKQHKTQCTPKEDCNYSIIRWQDLGPLNVFLDTSGKKRYWFTYCKLAPNKSCPQQLTKENIKKLCSASKLSLAGGAAAVIEEGAKALEEGARERAHIEGSAQQEAANFLNESDLEAQREQQNQESQEAQEAHQEPESMAPHAEEPQAIEEAEEDLDRLSSLKEQLSEAKSIESINTILDQADDIEELMDGQRDFILNGEVLFRSIESAQEVEDELQVLANLKSLEQSFHKLRAIKVEKYNSITQFIAKLLKHHEKFNDTSLLALQEKLKPDLKTALPKYQPENNTLLYEMREENYRSQQIDSAIDYRTQQLKLERQFEVMDNLDAALSKAGAGASKEHYKQLGQLRQKFTDISEKLHNDKTTPAERVKLMEQLGQLRQQLLDTAPTKPPGVLPVTPNLSNDNDATITPISPADRGYLSLFQNFWKSINEGLEYVGEQHQ